MPAVLTPAVIRSQIEIVWPHGGAAVRDATLANITAYLMSPTGNNAPPCDWAPTVRLWEALNAETARPVVLGEKRMLSVSGRTFPVWDFNDVDVSQARDPANKLTFFVTVDGVSTFHNIWVHAADARTVYPQQDVPSGVVRRQPATVDGRIEIVWPHDNLPVAQASQANITAFVLDSMTKQAIPPGLNWVPTVRLHYALNADAERAGTSLIGKPRIVGGEGGIQFLAWDFNDVDVSLAQDPLNRIFYWVSADEAVTFHNIWAHGTDARTVFPQPDVLNSCR